MEDNKQPPESDPKPTEVVHIKNLPSDSHEVYSAYLLTICSTLLIVLVSIVTYYYPMYFLALRAIENELSLETPTLKNVGIIYSNL